MGMPIMKKVWIIDPNPARAMNLAIRLGIAQRGGWWLLDDPANVAKITAEKSFVLETRTAHQSPNYATIRKALKAKHVPVFAETLFEEITDGEKEA